MPGYDDLGFIGGQLEYAKGLADIAASKAHTNLVNLQTQELTQKLQSEQALRDAMQKQALVRDGQAQQQNTDQSPEGFADRYWQASQAMAKLGYYDQAERMAGMAAQIDQRVQSVRASQAREQYEALRVQRDRVSQIETLLRGVNSQQSLEAANNLFERVTGQPSPYRGQRYEDVAGELDRLSQSTISAKDSLNLQMKEIDLKSKMADRASSERHRSVMEGIAAGRLQTERDYKQWRMKSGGATEKSLPQQQIKYAADLISSHYKIPATEAYRMGTELAQAARELTQAHPGLSMVKATQAVYADWLKGNKFAGLRAMSTGRSSDNPLPLPPDRKLTKGLWYQTPKGPRYWNGSVGLSPEEHGMENLGPAPTMDDEDNGGDE